MKTYPSNPYYDDFDDTKGFHQILFKPGYAVQARELSQLQTILRGQIEKFGNHIFKHGSVVIPGNSFADLDTPYVKMQSSFGGSDIVPSDFEGKIIVGTSTGVRAVVKKAVDIEGTDPITFYVSYITGGTNTNVFDTEEEVYVETSTGTRAYVAATSHTGFGSLAFINSGVFYIKGTFVHIDAQSVIMSKYSTSPSCHVLLKIVEDIVSSDDDSSLLDPAIDSYNYFAPGADRVRIMLELTTLSLGSDISEDYIEIMRYNQGELEEHARYPSYSELEKSLARRTYDESGNYLVNGFSQYKREHLKTPYNNGVYTDGNRDKFAIEIQPGKGYIEGLEVEVIRKTLLEIDKGRTADHVKDQSVTLQNTYGRYIYVSHLKSLPNFSTRQTVDLYDDNDPSEGSATKIGEVQVVAIDYHAGDPDSSNAIYKLYIDQLDLDTGYSMSSVGGIRFDAAGSMTVVQKYNVPNPSDDYSVAEIINSGARSATVLRFTRSTGDLYAYRHNYTKEVPIVGDTILGASSSASGVAKLLENIGATGNGDIPILAIPKIAVKSIKNIDTNDYDITYTVWKRLVINTNGSGDGSISVTDGVIASPEAGNIVAVGPAGNVTIDKFSLAGGGTQLVITGGPTSVAVHVLAQVTKTGAQPKVKTLTTLTLSGVTPATNISLGKADIYRIVSITDASAVDVTSSYRLNNGQTDYYYGLGSIELVKSLPTSNIDITFEYFAHSGVGDYFSADSYATLGSDYISKSPKYVSTSTVQTFNLARCLDFRPTVGSSGSFSSGSPSLIDLPVVNTFDITSVQYYVPRIDVIYLNKDKSINVVRGVPKDGPTTPVAPESSIELSSLFIPAYTISLSDILTRPLKNYRYTMSDIRKLADRVSTVEYFSTLNSLETSLISYDIVDAATGLNRFKTGYLADNFQNTFTVCDFYNRDNRCTFFNKNLSAAAEEFIANTYMLDTSSGYQVTNGQITLPYTEAALISQTTATRATNLNPFMVFSWEGVMTIEPSFDTWIETQDLPTIFATKEETITVRSQRNNPPPLPQEEWFPPAAEVVEEVESTISVTEPSDPPSRPTVRVEGFLARDLGLVDNSLEGTAAWNATVVFDLDADKYDALVASVDPTVFNMDWWSSHTDTWTREDEWTGMIDAINTAYNSGTNKEVAGGTLLINPNASSDERYSPDDIKDFWQARQPA